jgi:hypothetical protein
VALTYEKIQSITVSNATTITIDFTSISQEYTDVIIVGNLSCTVHSNRAPIRVNNDATSNYSTNYLRGNGSTVLDTGSSNESFMFDNIAIPTNSLEGTCILIFNNYSNTNTYKTFLCRHGSVSKGTAVSVNTWRSTAAISSIQVIAGSGGGPGTNY